ncbi:uncharacterized protein PHACADRAFT_174215 [Phanerochaete carnosa HHB-10118-sp]|uniref:RBR-type E3 ubiquitin transferase n=1 Tax=Phanerochaete carnosa (strain HHB-10118-sp) TaxID=650164 RepID=K5WAP1_PHACS|nr:uncharacterized protein PHACADRAFT_174215 [Phanerochaete carnosa HHB-10118-sp]EKM56049.1 hypothetical protein PHACADRAFT_174215 [Phanerochaete carnosa HHB-10118-sp]
MMSDYSDDDGSMYDYDSDAISVEEDDDVAPATKNKGKEKSTPFDARSLSIEALQDAVAKDIRRVADLTGLQPPIASILLQYFRWNEDKLLERFMDSSQDVLREVGEPQNGPSQETARRPSKRARLDTPSEFMCMICCDTPPIEEASDIRCGHKFCSSCWKEYVMTKIKQEGQCFFKCMQDGCAVTVDEPNIKQLADDATFERYKELLRESYVGSNANLRFCPHPGCAETVWCTGGRGQSLLTEVPTVRCSKGHSFCFGCGHDSDHRPLICRLVPVWIKNARDDAGTSQWLKANTRSCPKCGNSIEKNGGCNRILCRHCQYQFCWLCMKKWESHGYNNAICNAWQEPEPDEGTNEAKKNLEKWLFYFDRFNNHELSAKLDQDLCQRTEEKMLEVQETSQLSWIESKFMQQAVDVLTACRLTLKWSYAMAYFLTPGNQKQIFEDLQADLEKAVEELSQMLEEDIETKTVKALRLRMVDKTVYVRGRHDVLLQDTAAGLAEGRWSWIIPVE